MTRSLRQFSLLTVIVMYMVLLGGNLVTKTGSGEGCGSSWPLCHGEFLPQFNVQSIIEYSHRAVSGIGGILVLIMALWVWRRFRHRPEIRLLAPAAVLFLIVQAGLGAWAVMAPQSPLVMALHFGVSLLSFCSVLLPYILVRQMERGGTGRTVPVSPRLKAWVWGALIYAYIVVYTGAYVRHTGSQLACPDWPLCNGSLLPILSGGVGIQAVHRLAAALAVVAVTVVWALAAREKQRRPDVYRGAVVAFWTLVGQVVTGGVQVLTRIDLNWTMLHSAIVILHVGALSYLAMQVMPEPDAQATVPSPAAGSEPVPL